MAGRFDLAGVGPGDPELMTIKTMRAIKACQILVLPIGSPELKKPELEDKDKVIARIHEAEKYIPLERLCLSPQCGFASCEIGNKITEEQQWAKLALVKEIAEEVWK